MKRAVLITVSLLLFGGSLGRAVVLMPMSLVSPDTRIWLLKQARARLVGKAIDESSAPQAAKAARQTTLFVTMFRRGQPSRPLAGSGVTLPAALKAAFEAMDPKAGLAASAPQAF